MERVEGLFDNALRGRKLLVEYLTVYQGKQSRYELQILIELSIVRACYSLVLKGKTLIYFLLDKVIGFASVPFAFSRCRTANLRGASLALSLRVL